MADEEVMVTTTDNPFSPFTNYGEWLQWDRSKGYNTTGLLARLTITSDELSEADQDAALLSAIDQIVELNISGVHTKVTRQKSLSS